MSDSNRVGLSFISESTWGTTPSGNLKRLRYTGESLKHNSAIIRSSEIRSDRQVADIARSNVFSDGDINGELSYGAFDEFMKAALFSAAWTTPVSITGIVYSCVAAGNSIDRSSGSFVSDGLLANQWIKVSGFTTAGNNGYFKIVSVAATVLVVSGGTLVNEAAGDTVTIKMGGYIANGTTSESFSIEKEFTDLSNILAAYRGMMIDRMSVNIQTEAINSIAFSLLGKPETSETATIGTGYTAAPTNDILNSIDNVDKTLDNASAVSITGLSLELTNNLRQRPQVGNLGPISLGVGSVNVTGYFTDAALITKYIDFTTSSIAVVVDDAAGNAYIIELPQVKFTSGPRNATGINTDVIVNLNFEAFRDPTESITIRITRFAVA